MVGGYSGFALVSGLLLKSVCDLVPVVCTFRLSVLSGRLHWSLTSGSVREERDLKRAAFSLLNRCKVWIMSENQSLGSVKTDLGFHNWLLDN